MEDVRRRLQGGGGVMVDDNEKDGSDSNCSDNMSGSGAFRPTASSPKENSKNSNSYPTPNISVGPPIQPPPHLLPYLYPHGIYNHVAPPLSLLHNPAMNPGLFLNAQLALAAQHPALFGHYSGHSPSSPLHNLKSHRFSPYSLPGLHQGSAFDAVTPGGQSNASGPPERSLSSSPPLSQHNLNSPSSNPRPQSASPTHSATESSSSAFTPQVPSNNNNAERNKNGNHTIDNGNIISNNNNNSSNNNKNSASASELKSMEKMVNGLEMHQNGTTVSTSLASSGSIRSLSPANECDSKKIINLEQ